MAVVMGAFLIALRCRSPSTAPTTESWIDRDANVLWSPTLGGRQLVLTEELLRGRAASSSAFTALYFTVYLVTDPTYREQFRDDVALDLRQAIAVRTAYRWSLRQH